MLYSVALVQLTKRVKKYSWGLVCSFLILGLPISWIHDAHSHEPSRSEVNSLQREVDRLKNELKYRPPHPGQYSVPNEVTFCGKRIDLTALSIRKRFETEFLKSAM